jgi:hypothetical protein
LSSAHPKSTTLKATIQNYWQLREKHTNSLFSSGHSSVDLPKYVGQLYNADDTPAGQISNCHLYRERPSAGISTQTGTPPIPTFLENKQKQN